MIQDLRYAFRCLCKTPRFTVIAVLILSVGIASNVFIFSLVNGLFLKPLPFPNPARLVDIDETAPKWNLRYAGINYADFDAWRSQNQSFEAMATFRSGDLTVATSERSERLPGQFTTHDLAQVFGIQPILGRMFTADEELSKGPKVALIGHHIWEEWFGHAPDVLGKTITVDAEAYEIIGVLPKTAVLPSRSAVWLPFASKPRNWGGLAIGRLKPGVTIAQASADLLQIHRARIPEAKENEITSPIIQPLLRRYLGDEASGIAGIVQSAVAILLLIACANIAGLMLARTLARIPEMGLRSALGASRWQLVRHLLAESMLLSLAGTVLGVLAGRWALDFWFAAMSTELPAWIQLGIDARVVLFICAASALCAAVAGLIPARHVLSRLDLRGVLGAGAHQATASSGRVRSLRVLVVAEIALALMLLLTAGLMGRAFLRVQNIDSGIQPARVLTYAIPLPEAKYKDKATQLAFFREHLERIRALPGVESASASTALPFSRQHTGNFFEPEGGLPGGPDAKSPVVLTRMSMPGYFETMGIALLAGRSFEEKDQKDVIIINETLARLFWPGQPAVGKRIRFKGSKNSWLEVIGVAHDVRHYGLEEEVRPGVYMPFYAMPQSSAGIVVRAKGEPTNLAPTLRELLRQQDPTLPVVGLATMEDRIRESLFMRRIYSSMTATFSLIAMAMAITGLYGMISYAVGQRTREFGIRLALGAQVREVFSLVLREGIRLAVVGGALGLAGGILAGVGLSKILAGVSPFDPFVLLGAFLALSAFVVLACLIPALRATKVNPIEALRAE